MPQVKEDIEVMKSDLNSRSEILRALIGMSYPLGELADLLKDMSWDSNTVQCNMTAKDAEHALRLYLEGALDEFQIELWANIIECREDIDFPGAQEGLLRATIHELANPVLTEPLNKARAQYLILTLKGEIGL